jgi:hypothetical protein
MKSSMAADDDVEQLQLCFEIGTVVALTANAMPDQIAIYRETGMDDHLAQADKRRAAGEFTGV